VVECISVSELMPVSEVIGDTASLKVLAIRAIGNRPAPVLQGVLLSRGDSPLVGRVALQHVDAAVADEAIRESAEKTDAEFSSEWFAKNIRPKTINSVEFDLQDRLLYHAEPDGEPSEIEQKDMVAEVGRLLKDKFFLEDGNGKRRPFNPARHAHYPFNQAVTLSDK
jgi:hypothetical protein